MTTGRSTASTVSPAAVSQEALAGVSFKVAFDDAGQKTYKPELTKENLALAQALFPMSADKMAALGAAAAKAREARRATEREAARASKESS